MDDPLIPSGETGPEPDYTDVFEALASSEAELNRRFDDMELVMMELTHQLTADPEDLDEDSPRSHLHRSLTSIEEALLQGFGRLDRKLATARKRRRDEQEMLAELRDLLTGWSARAEPEAPDLAALIAPLQESLEQRLEEMQALIPPPALRLEPDLSPLKARLDQGFEQMAGLLAEQDARLGSALERLGEAPPQAEATDPQTLLAPLREMLEAQFASLQGQAEAPDLSPLREGMEQGFDRLASLLGARDARLEAERKGLTSLRKGLEAAVTRLGETPQTPPQAEATDPETLLAPLREMLETHLEAIQSRIPDQTPAAPDLSPLRQRIDQGFDRLAGLLGAQDHRFEGERRRLALYMGAQDSLLRRLDATAGRLESTPSAAPDLQSLDARLARIEAALATAPKPDGTAEAIRDFSMVLAEMMARQERLMRENAPKSAKVS